MTDFHAGRAAYENAKDATVDTGRYIAGRVGAVANGDNRNAGMRIGCDIAQADWRSIGSIAWHDKTFIVPAAAAFVCIKHQKIRPDSQPTHNSSCITPVEQAYASGKAVSSMSSHSHAVSQ